MEFYELSPKNTISPKEFNSTIGYEDFILPFYDQEFAYIVCHASKLGLQEESRVLDLYSQLINTNLFDNVIVICCYPGIMGEYYPGVTFLGEWNEKTLIGVSPEGDRVIVTSVKSYQEEVIREYIYKIVKPQISN